MGVEGVDLGCLYLELCLSSAFPMATREGALDSALSPTTYDGACCSETMANLV